MIRVIIERKVADGLFREFEDGLRKTRQLAVTFPGYISGESLVDVSDGNHRVVISTWGSVNEWQMWLNSDERQQSLVYIAPCLVEPETYTVLEPQ